MDGWQALETQQVDGGLNVSIPKEAPDAVASVVVVKVHGKLNVATVLPTPSKDGSLSLFADMAYLHNNEGSEQLRIEEGKHGDLFLSHWTDADAFAEWSFQVDQPGSYQVLAELSLKKPKSKFLFGLPGQLQPAEVVSTEGSRSFKEQSLGTIKVDKAGECTLQMKPEKGQWQPFNLRRLILKKQ
jgi:hypothetical protein